MFNAPLLDSIRMMEEICRSDRESYHLSIYILHVNQDSFGGAMSYGNDYDDQVQDHYSLRRAELKAHPRSCTLSFLCFST